MKLLRLGVLLLACAAACRSSSRAESVRPPAVAGSFYPGSAEALSAALSGFLEDAVPAVGARPIALVAPHAGYVYSGQIAADAFQQARGHDYDLVVIVGPNHTAAGFRRVSVSAATGFATPLGTAAVDARAAAALVEADPDCVLEDTAQAREHSVEVQVPFVQRLFPKASILPVVIGSPDPAAWERLGRALGRVLEGRRALIVASSDLSHYPSARDAARADGMLLASLGGLDPAALRATIAGEMTAGVRNLETAACGESALVAAVVAARELGARAAAVVSYANSGDSALGEANRAVGYAAACFLPTAAAVETRRASEPAPAGPPAELGPADQRALLAHARKTIRRFLESRTAPLARGFPPELYRSQGAFVTLKKGEELRGCIGRIGAEEPLARLVGSMALQAAFNDPRFPSLAPAELAAVRVEISVLTPPRPVAGPGEIVPGRDGVILEKDGRSAVFLPQVATEQGWGRDELLDHLARKAGLPAGSWRQGARFQTFQAQVFGEPP